MVTIPTIDQISGTTVMNKMRSLIHAFINFATGIDDEITEFENTVTQDFYTKLEVDTKFSDYYTKSEITTMFSSYFTKTEINTMLGDYYTKLQIDSTLADYYTDSEVDTLLDAKQDVLTAGTNITIENNVISASGGGSSEWIVSQEIDCRPFIDSNDVFTKDVRITICKFDSTKPNKIQLVIAEHIFYKGDRLIDNYSNINFTVFGRLSSDAATQYSFLSIQGLHLRNYSDSYNYFSPNDYENKITDNNTYYTLSINKALGIRIWYNKTNLSSTNGDPFMVVFTHD